MAFHKKRFYQSKEYYVQTVHLTKIQNGGRDKRGEEGRRRGRRDGLDVGREEKKEKELEGEDEKEKKMGKKRTTT